MWHFTRFGKFSEGLRCLISSGILYTYLNSSREQLRKIDQLLVLNCSRLEFRYVYNIPLEIRHLNLSDSGQTYNKDFRVNTFERLLTYLIMSLRLVVAVIHMTIDTPKIANVLILNVSTLIFFNTYEFFVKSNKIS